MTRHAVDENIHDFLAWTLDVAVTSFTLRPFYSTGEELPVLSGF
jgi:hypothetical protein